MADEETFEAQVEALDAAALAADTGPDDIDVGETILDTAKALGISEPPTQKTQGLLDQHPEIWPDYEEAVLEKLVIRDAYPPTADTGHTTYPFLTLYEKTKVLSLRAAQLAKGATAFIDVPDYLTDVYEIAKAELEAKRLPYILKRQLPDGTYEYWRLADLMIV
jgi:DNA-directed RNA polymerase I, II, and III subunit RPABC2